MLKTGSHQPVKGVDEAQQGVNEHHVADQVSGPTVLEFRRGERFAGLSLVSGLFAEPGHEHHQAKSDRPHEAVE